MMKRKRSRTHRRAVVTGIGVLSLVAFCATLTVPAFSQDDAPAAKKPEKEFKGDPYPLATCPVSGAKLGSMGEPVVYEHEGREIRFCCKSCEPAFKENPAKYLEKIDEKIIEQQLPHYPITTCVVSKESLESEHMEAANIVVANRLVRLCCIGCQREARKNPQNVFEKLDAAVIEKQMASYPLETCVVTGAKLGAIGQPVNYVIGNRLVRMCCSNCVKKLRNNPLVYLAKIDEAKKAQGSGGHAGHNHPH